LWARYCKDKKSEICTFINVHGDDDQSLHLKTVEHAKAITFLFIVGFLLALLHAVFLLICCLICTRAVGRFEAPLFCIVVVFGADMCMDASWWATGVMRKEAQLCIEYMTPRFTI
jgi:hypothetical protein